MPSGKRIVKPGEALALRPEELRSGRDAIWWDYMTPVPANERCGDVAVVHVRGSLEHHADYGCDSYEQILERVRCAMSGEDVVAAARRRAYWDDDVEVPEAEPPSAVVLRIDSPGGVVSGLNQTVFALRKMASASGIPLVAFVDELAASAAYALACACDEILLPPSGIAGSVGVISTMCDQTKADEKMGLRVVTITSGARKADGHPHVSISDESIAAETRRVKKLAGQFFRLVADVRPLNPKQIDALQAGIFLGGEAVKVGLADAVMSWEDTLEALSQEKKDDGTPEPGSKLTRKQPTGQTEKPMSLAALKALVKRTEKAIAAEKDPKERKKFAAALTAHQASLEAYKKMKHVKETHESEEGGEEDEDEKESESSEESEEEEAKGNETDRKQDDDSDDDDGGDDDGDEEEEDNEEEEAAKKSARRQGKAALALIHEMTGEKGGRALGAARALFTLAQQSAADIRTMKAEANATKKATLIREATGRYLTKHDAKWLAGQKLATVEGFIAARKKAGVIAHTDDSTIVQPKESGGGGPGEAALPAATRQMIDAAVAGAPENVNKKELRAKLVENHLARMNGASGTGRY